MTDLSRVFFLFVIFIHISVLCGATWNCVEEKILLRHTQSVTWYCADADKSKRTSHKRLTGMETLSEHVLSIDFVRNKPICFLECGKRLCVPLKPYMPFKAKHAV